MLCPEGTQIDTEEKNKNDDIFGSTKNVPIEGNVSSELNSYKNPKTWKKSITNFFRNQLRSTRSNDGDRTFTDKENFEEKEITPGQKWQSLGKVFRRQSIAEQWHKSPNQQGESSSQVKRHGVRKVISTYFGKSTKNTSGIRNEEN